MPTLLVDLKRRKLSKSKDSPLNAPILLTSTVRGENIVFRYCSIAKKNGISSGLSLTTASALAPAALAFPFYHQTEHLALTRLAEWAYQFSPLVGIEKDFFTQDPLDLRNCGITLDISGSLRIFKGEENLITLLQEGLLKFSLQPRIAIAPSHGAAWALSRYHKTKILRVDSSCLLETIKQLPIAALRLDPHTEENLKQLNIRHLGDLLKIPRPLLFSRFGPEILKRINEVLGQEEVLPSHKLSSPILVSKTFEPVICNKNSIYEACSQLLKKLLEDLVIKRLSLVVLKLTLQPLKLAALIKTITLSVPQTDHQHILNLINYQLELLTSAEGFATITLEAVNVAPVIDNSKDLFNPKYDTAGNQEQGKFLDALKHAVGEDSIFTLKTYASYLPEKSFSFEKLETSKSDFLKLPNVDVSSFLRPSIILSSPQEIFALSLLPDYPPQSLRWKDVSHKVIKAIGPERIGPEWWNSDNSQANTRDYFCLQLSSGTWIWAFRDLETSAWFIHGIWA